MVVSSSQLLGGVLKLIISSKNRFGKSRKSPPRNSYSGRCGRYNNSREVSLKNDRSKIQKVAHVFVERLFNWILGVSYFNRYVLHPVEFEREKLTEVSRFSAMTARIFSSLTYDQRKTLENRFFISSRLVAGLAQSAAMGTNRRDYNIRVGAVLDAAVDILAQGTKLLINIILDHVVSSVPIVQAPLIVSGFGYQMESTLQPFAEKFADLGDRLWVIYGNYNYPLQRDLLVQYRHSNRRAVIIYPSVKLVDVGADVGKWCRSLLPFLLRSSWSLEEMYSCTVYLLLLLEMAAERSRVRTLTHTACRLVLTQDDSDYMAYYRNKLLRRAGIVVIGVMHGVGAYGPNQAYDAYCVWGTYLRDRYNSIFSFPEEMIVVTGKPGAQKPSSTQRSRETDSLTLLLQPNVSRNRWPDMRDMVQGFSAALKRFGSRKHLIIKLHPTQDHTSIKKLEQLVALLGLDCEFIPPHSHDWSWIDRSALCVANFSTIGLETIAMGVPTIFFCKASRDLVPMAQYVPRCHVRSTEAYTQLMEELIDDPLKRQAFLNEEKEALKYFFAEGSEALIEKFCSNLKKDMLEWNKAFVEDKAFWSLNWKE